MLLGLVLLGAACVASAAPNCEPLVQGLLHFRDYMRNSSYRSDYTKSQATFLNTMGLNVDDDEQVHDFLCRIVDDNVRTIAELWRHTGGFRGTEADVAMGYLEVMLLLRIDLTRSRTSAEELQKSTDFLMNVGYPFFPLELSSSEIRELVDQAEEKSLQRLFHTLVHWPEDYGPGILKREELITALATSQTKLEFYQAITPWDVYGTDDLDYELNDIFNRLEEDKKYSEKLEQFKAILEKYDLTTLKRGGPEVLSCESLSEEAISLYTDVKKLIGDNTESVKYAIQTFFPDALLQLDDDTIKSFICQLTGMKSVRDLPSFISASEYYYQSYSLMYFLTMQNRILPKVNEVLRGVIWTDQTGFPDFPLEVTEIQVKELLTTLNRDFSRPGTKEKWLKALIESQSLEELTKHLDIKYYMQRVMRFVSLLKGQVRFFENTYFASLRFITRLEEYGLLMLSE